MWDRRQKLWVSHSRSLLCGAVIHAVQQVTDDGDDEEHFADTGRRGSF